MKEFDHRSRLAENFEEKTYLKSSTIDEDSVDTAHFDNTYDSDLQKEDENTWEESEIELKSLLTANCKPEMLEKDPLASSNLYVVKKEREKAVIREIGLYICQICSEGFTKRTRFHNHYRKHGKNLRKQFPYSYAAKKTTKVVRDKIKCTREKKKSKSAHTFNCIVCSQKFSSVYTLKKHLQAEHSTSNLYVVRKEREKAVIRENRLYICQICSESFTKRTRFHNHYRKHAKNLREQFPSLNGAKKTIEVVRDKIECTREKKMSKSVHTFYCIVCSQKFSSVYTLKKHLQAEHSMSNLYVVRKEREKAVVRENRLYICQICSESFIKRTRFHNHYRKHAKNLREQFPYSYAAKKTIEVVPDKIECTREKKMSKSVHTFNCIVCSQKFSRVYRLKKHLQAEHNISEDPRGTIKDIRPIQIEDFGGEYKFFYCLCSCIHKGDQRKHEDFSHNDETPFVCDLCYCSFPKDIYLKHHISKFHRQVSINLRQISLEKTDTFMANSNQSSQETNAPKSSRNGSSNETSFSIDHSELNSNSTLLQKTPNKRISQVTVKNQASSVNKSPDLRYNAASYFSHDNISEEERYDSDMNSVPSSSHEIIENLAEQEVSDENSVPSSDEIIEKVMKQEVNDEVCQKKQVDYKRELEKIPECESDHDEQLWSQFVILDDD